MPQGLALQQDHDPNPLRLASIVPQYGDKEFTENPLKFR
jgi:hypothetical protein